MPANLTPQYLKAEEFYKQAQTPEDKLMALEEMFRIIPKHKGTERMQGEIKHKISQLKKEQSAPKKGSKRQSGYTVDSNGYPQVVVVGPPNSGKSKLISELSGADLKVADYPFTTRMPQPAMMPYENIQIQLVDTPAIAPNFMDSWMPGIVRSADMIILLVDLASDDALDTVDVIYDSLKTQRVYLNTKDGEETIGDAVKPTLLVGNKKDVPQAKDVYEMVCESYQKRFPCLTVSAVSKEGLSDLKQNIFKTLDIIRIYPKPPGRKAEPNSPIVLPHGCTVVELADHIHHDLAKTLKSARVWGAQGYIDGQRVPMDFMLEDGNIVELET
jgi:small GTP-binding protein